MSKTVDQRVVEMQFDNRQFERNVSTTMSTLDKLKQSLNLTGASRGLENINTAANRVDMNPLQRAVETVNAKFSALEVMGVTALANITNSAVNAGKRIVSALTIEPRSDGFKEYELTLNAIQTTMAGTGKTADEVQNELKKLDEYADKTVYSTADMLNNLPKFTNAGVDLEKATTAMIGIANATALAGGDAGKASIAFYNLGQAIGTGYLTRMDYNSINNAGIATMEWKNQMVEAAMAAGTLTKVGEDAYKAGNKTLTLQQLFIDGLQEQWATTDVMMKVFGDYGNEATEVGKKAYSAAQDLKTYTQMMDSLKATAGTGWKDTWQILVGDLDEAKALWTNVGNAIGGVLTKMSDARNNFLKGALNSKWDNFIEKVEAAGISTETFSETLIATAKEAGIPIDDLIEKHGSLAKVVETGAIGVDIFRKALRKLLGIEKQTAKATDKITMSAEELDAVAKRVMNGEFGNGIAERTKKLTEAGYDFATVQNRVNELLGSTVRHSSALTEGLINNADALAKLSDEELVAKGYTKEQVEALRELQKAAEDSGSSIDELINSLEKPSGREMILETISNILGELKKPLDAFKEAWDKTFTDKNGDALYRIIEKLYEFSQSFEISEEACANFQKIFEGLFAAWELSFGFITASLNTGLKLLRSVLSLFGTDLLTVAASVADYIIKVRDWVENNTMLIGSIDKVAAIIVTVIKGLHDCIKAILELNVLKGLFKNVGEWITNFVESLGFAVEGKSLIESLCKTLENFFDRIETWIKGIDSAENIGQYIIDGLVNGIKKGITTVVETVVDLATKLWTTFANVLGIESPSKVFIALGGFIIAGLVYGLKKFSPDALEKISEIGGGMFTTFTDAISRGATKIFGGIKTIAANISKWFSENINWEAMGEKAGNVFSTMGDALIKLKDYLDRIDFGGIAIAALGIFGGVKLYKMADKTLDVINNIVKPLKAFGDVADAVKGLTNELKDSVKKLRQTINFKQITKGILNLALAIGVIALSLFLIAGIEDEKKILKAGIILVAIGATLALLAMVVSKLDGLNFDINGKTAASILGLGIALLSIGAVLKLLSGIPEADLEKAVIATLLMMAGIMAIASSFGKFVQDKSAANFGQLGKTVIAIAGAMLVVALVAKIIGGMDDAEFNRAAVGIGALMVFVLALTRLSAVSGKGVNSLSRNANRIGKMALQVALAMGVLAIAAKLIATMNRDEMIKAAAGLTGLVTIVGALVLISALAGEKTIAKVGATILGIAGAMLALTIAAKFIAGMKPGEMIKGALGLLALTGIIALLILAVKMMETDAPKIAITLLGISAAVAILAGVAVLLGFVKTENLIKGITAMGFLSAFVAAMVFAARGVGDSGKTLLFLTIAIGVMAVAIGALSLIDAQKLAGPVAAMSVLMYMFGTMASMIGTKVKSGMGHLIVLTVAVGVLAAALWAVSRIPAKEALAAAGAISLVLLAMAGAFAIIGTVGQFAQKSMGILIVLTVVVAGLAAVLWGMSALETKDAIANAIALSTLLLSMSIALGILAAIGTIGAAGIIPGILGLLLFVGAVGLLIGGLALLNGETGEMEKFLNRGMPVLNLIGQAIGEFVGSMFKGFTDKALSGLVEMANTLSSFMDAFKTFSDGASGVGSSSLEGVKNLAEMVLILTAASFLDGITSFLFGSNSLEEFGESLSGLGTSVDKFLKTLPTGIASRQGDIDAACKVITSIATASKEIPNDGGLLGGLVGNNSLGDFGKDLGNLGKNIASFINALPSNINDSAANGVEAACDIILTLANAAKEIPNEGGLWAALCGDNSLAKFGNDLPVLAGNLSQFMYNLNALGQFKSDASVQVADRVASVISALGGVTDSIPNISLYDSLIDFGEDLPTLGAQLSQFVHNLTQNGMFLDGDAVKAAEAAGGVISALATAAHNIDNTGGVWAFLFGDNGLAKFGEDLPGLGTNISKFVKNLGTLDPVQIASVHAACGAMNALGELKGTDSGAVSIGYMGDQLATFGTKLRDFYEDVKSVNFVRVDSAIAAITTVSDMLSKVVGFDADSIDAMTDGIKKLANVPFDEFLAKYSVDSTGLASVGFAVGALTSLAQLFRGIVDLDSDSIKYMANGIDKLASASFAEFLELYSVPSVGLATAALTTLTAKFKEMTGIDSFSVWAFADGVTALANSKFNEFVEKYSVSSVGLATAAITTLCRIFMENMYSVNDIGAKGFASCIKLLEEAPIGSFLEKYGVSVANAVGSIASLVRMINSLVGIDTSGIGTFKSAIGNLASTRVDFSALASSLMTAGGDVVNGLISGVEGKKADVTNAMTKLASDMIKHIRERKEEFETQGTALMMRLTAGIQSQSSTIIRSVTNICSSTVATIAGFYTNFYKVGGYLVEGFAKGIDENTYLAEAKARAMAKVAEDAAKEELDENSPSKVFYTIGDYAVQGFANAFGDGTSKVFAAGAAIAEYAKNGLSSAIGKVLDVINTDMDFQPTIRPVMDLSNVQSGVGAIAGMFSNGATIGVATNVGAISSMMNQNGQNGIGSDVISAIEKLRSDLGNISKPSYNIGNVTYEEGTDVAEAFKTIVRAVKIERRS